MGTQRRECLFLLSKSAKKPFPRGEDTYEYHSMSRGAGHERVGGQEVKALDIEKSKLLNLGSFGAMGMSHHGARVWYVVI